VNKAHAAIISIALGVAALAGTYAALQTTSGGAQAASVSPSSDLSARRAQLDRLQAKIERAAKKRPPALPAIPSGVAAAGSQSRSSSGSSADDDSYEDEQSYDDDNEHSDEHADEDEHEDDGDDD
jgi:hypothetical protein